MDMDELTTERLHLRPLTLADFEADYAMVGSNPNVTWDHQVHPRDKAVEAHHRRLSHWEAHGFGMWAAIEKFTGLFIGHGGLQYLEQTGDVEVGYYLGEPSWRKGYATELGKAAIDYGFTRLKLPHIVAVVRPENHASQHVLSKLGLRFNHEAFHYGFNVQVWRVVEMMIRTWKDNRSRDD
jgi:ribosomal-protein-alanine N-acetyltransferase